MSEMRPHHVPEEAREAEDVRQVQVAELGCPPGTDTPRQAPTFHCRACNYFLVDTQAASFGALLEHIGLYHSELYPNLAVEPLVLRGDLKRWMPKVGGP